MPCCIHYYGKNFKVFFIKSDQTLKQYFGGDIQKFSEKLPGFKWGKYKGEKHLPSYNYLGPGTRLDIRLDENNIPKPGEEPINEIDQLAYIHDLAYKNSSNIQDRHKADLEMTNGLKQLQNLSIPQRLIRLMIIKLFRAKIKLGGGERPTQRTAKAQAIDALYKQPVLKQEPKPKGRVHGSFKETSKPKSRVGDHPKVSTQTSDVKTKYELDKMVKLANELHKPFRKPEQLRKINFRSKDNIWNADLVMMPVEDGYKYILTAMDGWTRHSWVIPLKHKDGLTVSKAFEEIMKKSRRRPNKLWVDQGYEFYNQHLFKLFRFKKEHILEKDENGEYKNQIYSVFNASKNPVIERFNRTLTNKLWKQFTVQGNQKWLKILQPTVSKYNNTIHSTIGTTPALASKDPSLVKIQLEPPAKSKPKFKVNDRVRIFKWKDRFEKGYRGYWTKEIFRVTKVKNTTPVMYEIQDLNNEDIKGSFYQSELQKTYF